MKKKSNCYECVVSLGDFLNDCICCVQLKGLYNVCKFLETVDFHLVEVDIISPTGYRFNGYELFKIWSEK